MENVLIDIIIGSNTMETYDVCYLEDSIVHSLFLTGIMPLNDISFKHCTTLDGLKEITRDNDFRIYLLDVKFPKSPGDTADSNFPLAAIHVESTCENPLMIGYSIDSNNRAMVEGLGAKFYSKTEYNADRMVGQLAQLLDEQFS